MSAVCLLMEGHTILSLIASSDINVRVAVKYSGSVGDGFGVQVWRDDMMLPFRAQRIIYVVRP